MTLSVLLIFAILHPIKVLTCGIRELERDYHFTIYNIKFAQGKILWYILHPLRALNGERYVKFGFQIKTEYLPLDGLKEDNLYGEDGNINPMLDIIYDTREINGYTIIDNYTHNGISVVIKKGKKPIIVQGSVLGVKDRLLYTEIATGTKRIGLGATRFIAQTYRYILKKNLTGIYTINAEKALLSILIYGLKEELFKSICRLCFVPIVFTLTLIIDILELLGINIGINEKFNIEDLDSLYINSNGSISKHDEELNFIAA